MKLKTNLKRIFLTLIVLSSTVFVYAQNTVGIGTTTPDTNAVLDLKSPGNNQGILVPRLSTAQRTAMTLTATQNGLMVYDIGLNQFMYWNGTTLSWQGIGGSSSNWTVSGSNIYNSNAGNVGIGTSTPLSPLQIGTSTGLSTLDFGGGNKYAMLTYNAQIAAGPDVLSIDNEPVGLLYLGSDGSTNPEFGVQIYNTLPANTSIMGPSPNVKMVLKGKGFGINVDNPSAGLDIQSLDSASLIMRAPSNGNSPTIYFRTNAGGYLVGIRPSASTLSDYNLTLPQTLPSIAGQVLASDLSGNAYWATPSGGADTDWTEDASYIYNISGKNVGIGTSTPAYPLHVGGSYNTAVKTFLTGALLTRVNGPGYPVALRLSNNNALANSGTSLVFEGNRSGFAKDAAQVSGYLTDQTASAEKGALTFFTTNNGVDGLAERMRVTSAGNVGIGTITPNAQLQFGNTIVNRKIVLYESANDEHQFSGLGINTGLMRYQVGATNNDHVFYAGSSSTTSNELMRIKGTGNVGIGNANPNAPLQFANAAASRKIVLFESANDDHQFSGFGINTGVMRYQVGATNNDHVFYAGTSSTTSNELMRITGTGNVGIGTTSPSTTLDVVSDGGSILIPRKSTAGDPTGTNGMIYYNTNMAKFRVFENGTWKDWVVSIASGWSLLGNAGTTNGTNFIGTTDGQDLDIRTNNVIKHRFTQQGQLEFLNNGNSIFIGEGAGQKEDLSARANIFLGTNAGYNTNDGFLNVAIGDNALYSNVSGYGNVGIGYFSLYNTTSGENTAVGYNSLGQNTTGFQNSAFGLGALTSNISGNSNSAVGLNALYTNEIGTSNTAMGYQSLFSNIKGNNNSAFGLNSLQNNTADGNSAFGFSSLESNSVGTYNSAFGNEALRQNINGSSNTAMGAYSLNQNTGSFNTAFGSEALSLNSNGVSNTAVGETALIVSNGNRNSAVGSQTLNRNSTGSDNSTLGYNALLNNTIGNYNVAIGSSAGTQNVSGSNNTFVGYQANASANNLTNATAIGYNSLVSQSNSLILGSGVNVGIGTTAPTERLDVVGNVKFSGALMPNNVAGTANQVLTSQGPGLAPTWANASAGTNLYTADGSLTANRTVTQGANLLAFTSTETNGFSVDGNTFSVDALNNRVGIGTAAPASALHVNVAASTNTNLISFGDPTSKGYLTAGGSYVGLSTNDGVARLTITNSGTTAGNVGIGTSTPATKLEVKGNIKAGTSVVGGTTVIYNIPLSGLVNQTNDCGMANGWYGATSVGFTWTSTGSGAIASLSIEFNSGVDCNANGTLSNTTLNATPSGTLTTTANWCSCTQRDFINVISPPVGSYNVGGVNTLLIATPTSYGMVPNSTWPAGTYARVTVNYGGTITANGDVEFMGALKPNGASGNAGQVLTSQGAGAPVWQNPTTGSNLYTADGTLLGARIVSHNDNDLVYHLSGTGAANFQVRNFSGLNAIDVEGDGDVNFDNGTMFVDQANNKVGIGTTTPYALLEVRQDAAPGTNNNEGAFINIHNNNGIGGYMSGIRMKTNTATNNERFNTAIFTRWNSSNGSKNEIDFAVQPNGVENVGANDIVMSVHEDGKVGIGTTAPSTALQIHSTSGAGNLKLTSATTGNTTSDGFDITNDGGTALYMWQKEAADWYFVTSGGTNAMTIKSDGKIGIGTTTTAHPLEVGPAGFNTSITGRYFQNLTPLTGSNNIYNSLVSIKANGGVWSTEGFYASSDARIKDIVGLSNSNNDLTLLNGIKITDYTMKDKVQYGDKAFKKVIAQELETVYPQAVSKAEEFIPNIYELATDLQYNESEHKLTISLKNTPDCKNGDLVKVITEKGNAEYEVEQVSGRGITFKNVESKPENVFVYGKKVDDFRTVDYEALTTLNISATQELFKLLQTQQTKISELEVKVQIIDQLKQENASLKSDMDIVKQHLGIGVDAQK